MIELNDLDFFRAKRFILSKKRKGKDELWDADTAGFVLKFLKSLTRKWDMEAKFEEDEKDGQMIRFYSIKTAGKLLAQICLTGWWVNEVVENLNQAQKYIISVTTKTFLNLTEWWGGNTKSTVED